MSISTDPLAITYDDTVEDLCQRITEYLGLEMYDYTRLDASVVKPMADRLGVDSSGYRREVVIRIRSEHPELDESRSLPEFSIPELRELYASLERGETFDE
ncbi:hypothetical protein RH831_08940 [Halodesulfurarchaeum sp. HSR-GB]|uniref:hypothetical protein n=1 Tax=Halodesulfurarchaeum sp. HSR-GB TaxID=3074077 RepID=UPI0028625CFF|nr:hypothetical protein [Halodesulfurarchaeum sp. HSR-GB]MDR5657305.1 hypothetical protein [Halodesulfurarchaeum sp. HSR-GB]